MIQPVREWKFWVLTAVVAVAGLPGVARFGIGLPAAAATVVQMAPVVEVAGRVTGGAGHNRDVKVQAGTLEITMTVPKNARIVSKGRSISVHEINTGDYVRAHGRRSGNTKITADAVQVIGDRYDFMKSKYGKVNGDKGFVRKAKGM
jgi:hypothetical protein